MARRPSRVTDTDVALLRSIGRTRSVVDASRSVGISRDRAVYRLDRLAHAFGGPVVESRRGGSGHGRTTLTALGDRVVRGGFDSVELIDARPLVAVPRPNLIRGVYRVGPPPEVVVDPRLRLRVAFPGDEGEAVRMLLDPDAIVVARRRFASSARNVMAGTVAAIERRSGSLELMLRVRVGSARLRVALTEEPIRQLGLKVGRRVVLYVKATALHRVVGPARGRPSDRRPGSSGRARPIRGSPRR